jgi:hypothetical protein
MVANNSYQLYGANLDNMSLQCTKYIAHYPTYLTNVHGILWYNPIVALPLQRYTKYTVKGPLYRIFELYRYCTGIQYTGTIYYTGIGEPYKPPFGLGTKRAVLLKAEVDGSIHPRLRNS